MLNFNIRRNIKTIKRRVYKLYNKLFIYLPVDLLIFLRNFISNIKHDKPGKTGSDEHSLSSQFSKDKRQSDKRIILFRHDGIGDYVLFRNFIEVLKKNSKFTDYKITLLGNTAWKNMAEFLDKNFIDEFIWLDKKKFTVDFFYRYKKFKEITSLKYEILIHPFSREFFNADNDLAYFIRADKKIGSIKIAPYLKSCRGKILEKIYTDLISDTEGIWFEFYKNKNFFNKILGEKIDIKKSFIKLNPPENPELKLRLALPPLYAALFIGASVKHRKWPAENFAEIARYLKTKYGMSIVLCGNKNELSDKSKFQNYLKTIGNPASAENPIPFIDTVGKISLADLLYVIKSASLVLSNETMAPHIAMALSNETNPVPPTTILSVIVISTGEASYGHFVPYPEEIAGNYTVVFHPQIEKNINDYIKTTQTFGHGYDDRFDIAEITVQTVLNKIDNHLIKYRR